MTGESATASTTPAPTGVFGTKIPSAVTFAVGVLLFLLPFAELKCKAPEESETSIFNLSKLSMTFTNSGLGLAIGSDWKTNMPSAGGMFGEQGSEESWKKDMKPQEPNNYAIVALALAVAGLALSFTSGKPWAAVGLVAGVLSAGALIGLMLDLQKRSKDLVSETQNAANRSSITEGSGFVLNFTPWFYIAIIALLVAAFFSYKRMQLMKK
ncbi:MAG: hypothetical protein JNK14_18430 [Chitinophagaceae bacterium]|nr:hypothetical protein [Chitinophagaceae bacterium]